MKTKTGVEGGTAFAEPTYCQNPKPCPLHEQEWEARKRLGAPPFDKPAGVQEWEKEFDRLADIQFTSRELATIKSFGKHFIRTLFKKTAHEEHERGYQDGVEAKDEAVREVGTKFADWIRKRCPWYANVELPVTKKKKDLYFVSEEDFQEALESLKK